MRLGDELGLGTLVSDGEHRPFSQLLSVGGILCIYLNSLGFRERPAPIPGRCRRFCSWKDPPRQAAILALNSLKKSQIALRDRLLLHQMLSL